MTDITAIYEKAYLAGDWAKQSEILNAYGKEIDFNKIPVCQLHEFCSQGDLANVKEILQGTPHLYADTRALYVACRDGHLHIAMFLFSLYTNDDKSKLFTTYRNVKSDMTSFENILRITCIYNQLEVAKWLHSVYPKVVDSAEFMKAFDNLCCSGKIEFVKWFYTVMNPKNKPNEYGNGYRWATNAGHTEIAFLIKNS